MDPLIEQRSTLKAQAEAADLILSNGKKLHDELHEGPGPGTDNPGNLRHWKGREPWEPEVLGKGGIGPQDQQQNDISGQDEVWIKEGQFKISDLCQYTARGVNSRKGRKMLEFIELRNGAKIKNRDILAGIAHLHSVGIVHRDLKPHNVLISHGWSQAKLCDMGISKQLADGVTAIDSYSTGSGSSGWQAPEQLQRNVPQTKSMDLFSLGCILFFSITGGYHPFGSRFERDHNIINGKLDLFRIEHVPEATDLLSALLQRDPFRRPHIGIVRVHPLFWSSEKRLKFLCDASDCVEVEDKESNSPILKDLEAASLSAVGRSWADKLDEVFLSNIGKYRKYNHNNVRDLLRVIRNKSSHFRELPQEVQQIFGSYPEGFEYYFREKFPRLLIEVFTIMYRHCKNEEGFRKYFSSESTLH
ncbi:hypothetical protein L7F22_000978 [Adiantum nelumboides]|nr:hypothetical protein [Adiantum nelumboides]